MQSINWREINWPAIALNSIYVWVLGLGIAFFGRVFGLDQIPTFDALMIIGVALITMWVSYRVALRAGQQPLVHGLLLGLLVGLIGFILIMLTSPNLLVNFAGFLLQVLGGFMGGRSAQRTLQGSPR